MCGIVGYIGHRDAYSVVIKGLKRLEYRGYDSAGIMLHDGTSLKVTKTKGKVADLEEKATKEGTIYGTIGMGHTRWATHGVPNDVNSHPHVSNSGKLVIIHNGIIENYEPLKKELIKRGYSFKSDTDTEVLVNLIEDVQKKENLLINGPIGGGKSYIASALGHQACLQGYRTLYFNAQKLFPQLNIFKADGTYLKQISRIERQDLLIIDDFGLKPLDTNARMMLLEIIEDRHGRRSTIISSQLPVNQWYEIIGDSTVADAILDRMVHASHRIELKGESMRKMKLK